MTKPRFSNIIRIFKLLGHTSFVLFFLALPFEFIHETNNPIRTFNPVFTLNYWIYFLSFVGYFYSFTYYLIPCFLLTRKYWKFAGIFALIFVFFFFLKPFERVFQDILEIMRGRASQNYDPLVIDFLSNFTFIMLTALGLSIQVVKQWRLSERRTLRAESEKKSAEIAFLKAQINPHFLFNTLNNIYSLAIDHDPHTAPSIMKLSNLMRYMTDDATHEFVSLDSELNCIRDYINLQSLRLGENVMIDFGVTGETGNRMIAPLILMTFIENTFKFGISSREPATINIRLAAEAQKIIFICQNRIFAQQGIETNTGIGLENTRNRLKLVYSHRFALNINTHNDQFTVHLELQD